MMGKQHGLMSVVKNKADRNWLQRSKLAKVKQSLPLRWRDAGVWKLEEEEWNREERDKSGEKKSQLSLPGRGRHF